ncbi:Hypothetical predicted protein [Podarcis lilfordi]|uniref:Uncharacterized protein n=1 Tax=Podarcis lilfordi TaxID=74358 RepID=A0AA35P8V9_9SAUR|nr:Hypothetical predicted protein [Podarcis lilfordi]
MNVGPKRRWRIHKARYAGQQQDTGDLAVASPSPNCRARFQRLCRLLASYCDPPKHDVLVYKEEEDKKEELVAVTKKRELVIKIRVIHLQLKAQGMDVTKAENNLQPSSPPKTPTIQNIQINR